VKTKQNVRRDEPYYTTTENANSKIPFRRRIGHAVATVGRADGYRVRMPSTYETGARYKIVMNRARVQ